MNDIQPSIINANQLTPQIRPTQYQRRKKKISFITSELLSVPKQSEVINQSDIDTEIKLYKIHNIDIGDINSLEFDPAIYFRIKENEFPILSKIAKKVFSLPATSVPSESLFSISGLNQTNTRNSLLLRMIDSLTFLKS